MSTVTVLQLQFEFVSQNSSDCCRLHQETTWKQHWRNNYKLSVTKQQDPMESNTDWLTDHGGSHGKVLDQSETHYGHTEKVPIPISEDMEAVMKRASPESEAHRSIMHSAPSVSAVPMS
ncbi:hypothetical protein WMY93_028351 [Mugilogobius chulae]|uniref:Uncharacterized protein n=1 Tax=Mugilogobius chulae TaxID=88201 RepID=A0AAW0MSP4_9GOBI